MIVRKATPKCGTCKFLDKESYRAIKTMVCYKVHQVDGKSVAYKVTESRKACNLFWEADQ